MEVLKYVRKIKEFIENCSDINTNFFHKDSFLIINLFHTLKGYRRQFIEGSQDVELRGLLLDVVDPHAVVRCGIPASDETVP